MKKVISKLKHKKNTGDSLDDFIVKYNQNNENKANSQIDIESLDIRRKVFISLIGLYRTWQNAPSFVLFSAIFILPLKKKYIYTPTQYVNQFRSIFDGLTEEIDESFIKMLQWKDSQGSIIFMLDDYECTEYTSDPLIDPFWYHLSETLHTLYDPISRTKYNKLNLDTKWWTNKEKFQSKYDVKTTSILQELFFLTMKYKTVSEILYQSNPSLHPIYAYEKNISAPVVYILYESCWWISSDYDANI
eukprot:379733_1